MKSFLTYIKLDEEIETIEELSKKTLGSYIRRAALNARNKEFYAGAEAVRAGHVGAEYGSDKAAAARMKSSKELADSAKKRQRGIDAATFRLTKEEIERLDELSKSTLSSYAQKAATDHQASTKKAEKASSSAKDILDKIQVAREKRRMQAQSGKGSGRIQSDKEVKLSGMHQTATQTASSAARKADIRSKGIKRAFNKLTTEDLNEGHKIGDPVIVTTATGLKEGVISDITHTHIGVMLENGGLSHYHPEYVKKKVEEDADSTLIEGVSWERWDRSHSGRKDMSKSNRGQWMISKHKDGYRYGHKEGEDHITVNGTGKEAAEAGKKWAKEKGHGTAYILESFSPEVVKSDISFGNIVRSALTTARKP